MERNHFWLDEGQFARLSPFLPNNTRGVARVDDRRVISGIVHVLKSGCRWVDAPTVYGPRKTPYNRFVCWAAKGVWLDIFHALAAARGPPAEVLIDSSAIKAHRCASGRKGGTGTSDWPLAGRADHQNPRALTDRFCRPMAFLLTGGQVADCVAADALLDHLVSAEILHADKGYDSDAVRRKIEAMGAAPNIPPKTNRRWKCCFSPYLYRHRNAIERMFGRLKDFRRIATRCDRLAHNFLAAVRLAATLCYWL
jgi:transposase